MERRHLRAEDGVFLTHLLGKGYFLDGSRLDGSLFILGLFCTDGSDQGTDTDPCRTQVVDLIDFQAGVDLVTSIQDLINLIGGNGIKSASEGIQLDQIQILSCFYKICGRVETGVIHPLVVDTDGTLQMSKVCNGVFGKYGDSVAVDHIRDTVVDFRVNMVWTACKNDSAAAGFFQVLQGFFTLFLDIHMYGCKFFPGFMGGSFYLGGRNVREFFHKAVCKDLFGSKCQERVAESDGRIVKFVHIVLDVFRIGSNDRAVVVVDCIRELVALVRDARIEDKLHTVTDQPCDMSVSKFCRIAFGLTWDGFDTQLIDLTCGSRRKHHLIFQFGKESIPKRIILKHVQNTRDTDLSTGCLVCGKWLIGKNSLIFIVEKVRDMILVLFFSKSTLTAVSTDIFTAAGEFVDGQTAVVGTSAAVRHGGGVLQAVDLINGKHGSFFTLLIAFPCDQSGTEGTHDSGDIRADSLTVGNFLKTAENRVIVEGTTLYNDVFSKLGSIGNLDNFVEGVFDNGVGKTSGDIGNLSAFLLGLLNLGVHKYSTACSKINRMFCKKSCFCKVLYGVVQGFCESLDKGTTTGGTCLVKLYTVYRLVTDLDAFHILTADIQDAVYFRIKESSCIVMGNSLNLTFIKKKSRFDQGLAVTGGAGKGNLGVFRKKFIDLFDRTDGSFQRISVVVAVE